MTIRNVCVALALVAIVNIPGGQVFAQSSSSLASTQVLRQPASATKPYSLAKPGYKGPFSTVGVAIHASTLGAGVDIATPLARRLNIRGTADFLRYNLPLTEDGIHYVADLDLSSGQVTLDWFPFGGFHISPGILISKNHMDAGLTVAAGQTFSLGNQDYYSNATDPVHGSAALTFPHMVAPELKLGFGNIIPRSGRHWSVPVELGAAYMGHPTMALAFGGTGCESSATTNCSNLATDPTAQQNVRQEQNDLNEDLKRASVYPIFSLGISYKF